MRVYIVFATFLGAYTPTSTVDEIYEDKADAELRAQELNKDPDGKTRAFVVDRHLNKKFKPLT